MKATLITLILAVSCSAAVEDVADQIIQICDLQLITALQRICEHKDYDYLIQNSEYDPNLNYHKHHPDYHKSNDHRSDEDLSIMERCCHKPCLVRDFSSFCGP